MTQSNRLHCFFLSYYVVNTDEVHDYLEVIKRPMDYSTIAHRLEQAEYGSELDQSSMDGVDADMDPMEVILLNVLCDVDQVHQVRIECIVAVLATTCLLSHQPLSFSFIELLYLQSQRLGILPCWRRST